MRLDYFGGKIDCDRLSKDTTVAELLAAQADFCRQHIDLCRSCGGECCRDSEIWVDNVFYRRHADLRNAMDIRENGEVLLRGEGKCPFQLVDGRCGRYSEDRMLVCQMFFCDKKAAEFYVRLVQCVQDAYHLALMYENMLQQLGAGIKQAYPLKNACANPVCNKEDYGTSIYDILLFLQDFYQKNQQEFAALPVKEQAHYAEQARADAEDLFLTQSVLTHYYRKIG